MILTSLQENSHVAFLLGFSALPPSSRNTQSDTHLAQILMKTLLKNMGFYTVSTQHTFIHSHAVYEMGKRLLKVRLEYCLHRSIVLFIHK